MRKREEREREKKGKRDKKERNKNGEGKERLNPHERFSHSAKCTVCTSTSLG